MENNFFLNDHQSEQLDQLFTALSKAQGEMDTAAKSSTNPFFKSKYADLTEIVLASRGCLKNNGLCVDQQIISHDRQDYLVTCLGHTSGQWKRSCIAIRPSKDDIQSFGSAITYLRRYCYASLIGMVVDEDDDGNVSFPKNGQQKTFSKPTTPRPSYGPEMITKEQYEQLIYELGDRDDIAEKIMKTYDIDDLKMVPKAAFMKIVEAVRNNKRAP